jgi:3',5'-cyclic AMP phosphodiesterase CpdA
VGNRIFAPPMNRTLMFIGDTHVGDNPRARWTKFADAFLADTANRPAGIVHIGDLTDQSDAASIALAKQWWARFPDPKCMTNGDHDLLNGMTLAQWQLDYATQEFKTVDFGFVAVITTNYAITATRRDEIIAAAAAVAPKPVYLCIHRPLRDTTTAGTAPHDNLSASAPGYAFAQSAAEDPLTRAAVNGTTNIIGVFSGHSHAWLDDPGAAITQSMGTRVVPVINTSAITYVGGVKQFFTDPIVALFVTLLPDNKTLEVRYRDYGANGVWTAWDMNRGRVTTLVAA